VEDKEIYDLVDKKQIETFDRLDNTVKKQTEVFLYETQEIRKSINALTEKVGQQNSRVHELEEWRAECAGVEKGIKKVEEKRTKKFDKVIKIIGIIITIIAIITPTVIGILNLRHSRQIPDLKTEVDYINTPVTNSRGETYLMPAGILLDSLKSQNGGK